MGPLARAFATNQLLELGDRLVTAANWNEWLEGVVVPPPAAGLPAYIRDRDTDPGPSRPSIDMHMKVELAVGGTAIVHIRTQKSYQPDLEAVIWASLGVASSSSHQRRLTPLQEAADRGIAFETDGNFVCSARFGMTICPRQQFGACRPVGLVLDES
jgi:hypothetical protein